MNRDERGCLTALEVERDVPFEIRRVFLVHDTVPGVPRGGHAHRSTEQVLVAVSGVVKVRVSDAAEESHHVLEGPGEGLYVGRLLWTDLKEFSEGAVLMVLASDRYDRSRSIRTWEEFIVERTRG